MPDINMPAPRVPFVDGRTGLMSREWFLFLSSLGNASSDGDKGDITVSANGNVYQINAGVVGTAELGGDITTAGKALLDDASASEQRTTLAINAENTPYSPISVSDWGGAEPTDVAEALDRQVSRITSLEVSHVGLTAPQVMARTLGC